VTSRTAATNRSVGLARGVLDQVAGHQAVIVGLIALVFLVYGFELFNFNLTIDEEVHAFSLDPTIWVSQQRWGLYVLNRVLMPYTVVPVVPLAIGLTLHFLAVLVLLKAWNVVDAWEQFVVGALVIATPTMAYIYTFSTIAYGIGAGLFLSALSLVLFQRGIGIRRYWAAVPAGFALGIYQPFGLALVCVFVVYLIRSAASEDVDRAEVAHMAGVGLVAIAIHLMATVIFMAALAEAGTEYVDQFIDLGLLFEQPLEVFRGIGSIAARVYGGGEAVFGHRVWALPLLLAAYFVSFAWRVASSDRSPATRLLLLLLFPFVLVLPFLGGLFSGGYVALRFLVAVPFAVGGVTAIGWSPHRSAQRILIVLAALVLLQFSASVNSLFGASHLALEQDRALGTRVIHQIELEMSEAPSNPRFLEIVGVPTRTSSELVPRSETFGASFFEWEQGNVYRIVFFLRTLGFDALNGLPVAERGALVDIGSMMPVFPAPGSVVVERDVVIVKFGPYSQKQISAICAASPEAGVCP